MIARHCDFLLQCQEAAQHLPKGCSRKMPPSFPSSEKNKGGWKTQGRGKHTIKPLPKNGLDPCTYNTFSPPVCSRPVIFLSGNDHRPDQAHFLRPPKLVLEGALNSTFSPPQKIARYVLPPPLAAFQLHFNGAVCSNTLFFG